MIQKILQIIFGSRNERVIKAHSKIVSQISELEDNIRLLTDEELKNQTQKFKEALAKEKMPEEILPEVFATVREAAWRTLGMRHFDVQLLGAMILHEGKIAEMRTGEGKTLTATAAVYLNSLNGQGVHVITVNDYLAKRDAEWMRPVYNALGVSVGIIQHDMDAEERQLAYQADVTYGTNSEFGFDYLRDNMLTNINLKVQRGFFYAIVDEVDSILIDEARTPLIISGPTEENTGEYKEIDRAVRRLIEAQKTAPEPEPIVVQPGKEEPHVIRGYFYDVDEKSRSVFLTEKGVHKIEEILQIENLYAIENTNLVAHINQALRAHLIFKDEVDYVVQEGQVVIVDEHTGRTMPGRRYSDGLHQAIEAKEKVEIKEESQTLASVTYQNFFRMYKKLSGMTGTADTEAEEFMKIYKLEVNIVPTNVPIQRIDYPDRIYCTEKEKFHAVIKEIKECVKKGQPTLVGTVSIEKSELLSALLKREGIAHNVLNARHHAREAEIIANAGKPSVVTVATNMAGRGTDIVLGGAPVFIQEIESLEETDKDVKIIKELLLKKQYVQASQEFEARQAGLGTKTKQALKDVLDRSQIWIAEHEKVKSAGGLHILGSERHESRRIDNQLRGRSGRQGDPGSSRFYLSLEDHLMRIFGGERIKNIMNTLGMEEGQELEASMVDRAIARAQKRVESHNFDVRKHLLEYDEVMNKQREFVYNERNRLLANENVRERLLGWIDEVLEEKILIYCEGRDVTNWNFFDLNEWLKNNLLLELEFQIKNLEKDKNPHLYMFHYIQNAAHEFYKNKIVEVGEENFNIIERRIALDVIDARWKEHLHQMDQLREGVWASGYAERNPLVEFKIKGFELFDEMVDAIKEQVTEFLFRIQIETDISTSTLTNVKRTVGKEKHNQYNSFGESTKDSAKKTELLNVPTSGGASQRRSSRRRKK